MLERSNPVAANALHFLGAAQAEPLPVPAPPSSVPASPSSPAMVPFAKHDARQT